MFRFPADPSRKKIWLAKIRRDAWKPTTYSRLCEAHFDSNQFENNRLDARVLLKPFAIPKIFPYLTLKVPRKSPTKRKFSSLKNDFWPLVIPSDLLPLIFDSERPQC